MKIPRQLRLLLLPTRMESVWVPTTIYLVGMDIWLLTLFTVKKSCLRVARLSPCRPGQPRYPDRHSPLRPSLLFIPSLSANLQFAFSEYQCLWLVNAAQFFVVRPRKRSSVRSSRPSAVDQWGNQCRSDYPWSLLDQVPSLRPP